MPTFADVAGTDVFPKELGYLLIGGMCACFIAIYVIGFLLAWLFAKILDLVSGKPKLANLSPTEQPPIDDTASKPNADEPLP